MSILAGCMLLFVVCSMWPLHCNNLAYTQRSVIIDNISKVSKRAINEGRVWTKYYDMFHSVTYDHHLWRLFTFRDPYKLYNNEIVNGQ